MRFLFIRCSLENFEISYGLFNKTIDEIECKYD